MKIAIVGLGGMPYSKRAIDARLEATANLFRELDHDVVFFNRFSAAKNESKSNCYQIDEPFASHKGCNKILYLLLYALALIDEPFRIIRANRKQHIDVLFVNSGHYIDMLVYKLLCKITGAKFLYQYCEFRAALPTGNPYHKLNGKWVGEKGPKLWDGVTPISHFLEENSLKVNPKVKSLMMYPLCDYKAYADIEPYKAEKPYILFCGSIEYGEIVSFIVDAYKASKINQTTDLVMVLRGVQQQIDSFKQSRPDVRVLQNLPYEELLARFKGADGLLIPLKNDIRDIARFPNKIGEYCAARGLVITTNNGEMMYLFKDRENALVAKDYTEDSYVEVLDWLADNIDKTEQIKEASYQLGLASFDIESYKEKTERFLQALINDK